MRLLAKDQEAGYRQEDYKSTARHISNVLWATAKLGKQPAESDLRLLLQTFLIADVLAAANTQDIANVIWAVAQLFRMPGWPDGAISDQEMQQVLGKQQIDKLLAQAGSPEMSNILPSLVRLAKALPGQTQQQLLSMSVAQTAVQRLLPTTKSKLASWDSQAIANALWCCGEFDLGDEPFVAAAIATGRDWLDGASDMSVNQAAVACARLGIMNEAFVGYVLQCGLRAARRHAKSVMEGHKRGVLSDTARFNLASQCGWAVARLDMQELAGPARDIVRLCALSKAVAKELASLRRLWVFHSWLLQHQLLDGKGLTGLLTEQQLQQGERNAEVFGVD